MSVLKFVPYANESDVLNIGNLSIENRLDRVTINGDVDLTRDQAGLVQARRLQQVLAAVVAQLEGQDLPAALPLAAVKSVANPFE